MIYSSHSINERIKNSLVCSDWRLYKCIEMCVPVSLSNERYQICPSSDVLKWSSDHIMLKLSSKEAFGWAASEDTQEAAMKAAV